nr:unnamed protein product [Digitaria exilis]
MLADACVILTCRTGPGDELAELLWDNGPALRRAPPPFQPFTCSAAGSSRSHELKRHAAAAALDMPPLGMHDAGGGLPVHDDDAVPWLHCPVVVDDDDRDTAPLPPDYCAGLLSEYPAGLSAAPPAVPASRAAPPQEVAAKHAAAAGEGVMNFTFFSKPLQRPQAAAASNHPVESTVVQAAATTNRLRGTPLFSEQRMAWLQQPPNNKGARATAATAAPPPAAPQAALAPPDHHRHGEAATVTQRRLQPAEATRAPAADAAAAAMAVGTTSSVCSGNGDRSQHKRSSHHHVTDCSVSPDEDLDDEGGGAMRRAAARSNKRSRTAEVHNLSERRRRDRINEKMRALQELIPNCNKARCSPIDKASMLEEAIEYLKTLQLQVQMMSMGTGLCVPPMLLPAAAMQMAAHPMAAHFPHLGMGLGFGMGAAAFDMARVAGAHHFPCPPMAMPPGPMFGVPGQAAMPFAHMPAGAGGAAPPEQMETAAAPARRGAEADHPSVPAVTQGLEGGHKVQHPKPT